jgi:glutathione S-transferase
MADYTFFTNPMSRGQIARWALHEAGADYEQVIVEYGQPKPLPCWPPTRWASCPR